MKILHVIQSIDPAEGGPPVVATRLAAAQAAQGHEVHLLAYNTQRSHGAIEKFLEDLPGKERLKFHLLDPPTKLEKFTGPRAQAALEKIIPQMDIVHAHGIWNTVVRVACKICRRHSITHSICVHGMFDPWCMRQKSLKKRIAMKIAIYKMFDKCTFIHCLNKDEVEFVQSFGFQSSLEVIPNGIFVEEFDRPPDHGVFRRKNPLIGDHPYILFLSRLHYKKGLDYLADAFAAVAIDFPQLRLVVAGPDGGAQTDFEHRIDRAGLSDRVLITGPIYGPEKLEVLVDAECFCLPSRQEGFSIAITEALALGLPVVVTQACHYPEISETMAGIETDLSVESVADGLRKFFRSTPEQIENMGMNGKHLVRDRFTWPIVAERSLCIYKKYLKCSSS